MIPVTERLMETTHIHDHIHQTDVACPECGRHIAKCRHPRDLASGTVWARAYCRRCQRWRWYDVVTGRPPDHHRDGQRMVG